MPFDVPSVEEMNALLSQYEFVKLAAYGGMGAVYKARQASLDRPVAVKILPPAFGSEAEFADRFKSEARAMARLNHTNIVTVYDFGLTREGHLYLVMEWVEGSTIHELLQKGTIPVRKVADLAAQLCEALSFAHGHKILHRDIKPGNIMVNEDGQVKVADFGLARPITGEAEENPYGTPDYVAPEITDKGSVDQRADIFAAGIVIYEMLTGRVPRHPRRSVTEYAPVSPRWDDIIAKATHRDPQQRYQDVRELRAAVMAAVATPAKDVLPVAMASEAPAATKGMPSWLPVAAGGVLIAAGTLWVLMSGGGEMPAKSVESNGEVVIEKPPATTADSSKSPVVVEPAVEAVTKPVKEAPPVEPAPPPAMEKGPVVAETPAQAPPAMEKPVVVVEPAPAPPAAPAKAMPPATPPQDDPKTILQNLKTADAELAALVEGFSTAWSANLDLDTRPARKELAAKYIPALQRSLSSLTADHREHVLSEISLVANQQPLRQPADTWPVILRQLRKTYDDQLGTIEAKAASAAETARASHVQAVRQLAEKRTAAGDAAGARRATMVAGILEKLTGNPTLDALIEFGGKM